MTDLERRALRRRLGADPYYLGDKYNKKTPAPPKKRNEIIAPDKDRETLEDAFYNEEEDVDIGNLTKGSPKQKFQHTKGRLERHLADEDRKRGTKFPSGEKDIWKGYPRNTGVSPEGKRVLTPGDYTKNIGNQRGQKSGVLTPGDYTRNIGNQKSQKSGALTPGDYTRNIGNEKSKQSRAVLTPGDYTKNIGKKSSASNYNKNRTNYATINGEKYGEAVNVSTSVKGEKTGGNNSRQVLENGFKQKKEEKKNSGFRGIKP